MGFNLVIFRQFGGISPDAGAANPEDRIFFVLMGVMTALSLRGFFNSSQSNAPELPATLQALTFPLCPLIAWQTVRIWTSGRWPTDSYFEMRHRRRVFLLGGLWLCLFGGGRIIGDTLRDHVRPYRLIQTAAGSVRLNDGGVSSGVYEFLKKNTAPGEPIADFAYGGGINFALHRTSPLYSTMFVNFLPSEAHRDVHLAAAEATAFAIQMSGDDQCDRESTKRRGAPHRECHALARSGDG
ncbi:MAG TPA: hypothetical protein VEV85_23635, partial [Bryobacteraceae bacterium]|nr:hypothetical protein [Bryobacteraceae bacterium]